MARTIVNIDDELLKEAQTLTGLKKKVDIVNFAIRNLVEQRKIEGILKLKGTVRWEGSLEEMRRGRYDPR